MSVFDDIQKKIDSLGYVSQEITGDSLDKYTAPITGKDEYEWYNNQIYTGGDRKLRLNEYEEMNTYAEIGSALDIYADDATQRNENGEVLRIFSEDEDIKEELQNLFYDRMSIESILWKLTRSLCLYGDTYAELVLQKDRKGVLFLKQLPPKSIWRIEERGKLKGFIQEVPNGSPVHFAPFEMVHWRLPSTIHSFNPYGTSILESARRPWRQLKLMEDAMVVYRITRAPERRIFKIDVGNLPTAQAEAFIERQRQQFRKKSFINKQGQLDYRANTMAPDEDFWVATRNGVGTEIDTLQGAENLGEVDDVVYFKDKIFAALKIPRIFLQDTEGTEERKQNVSQQDVMFARTIERIQNHVIEGLKKIAIVHLMLRGYKKNQLDDFELSLSPPSHLAERLELEIYNERTGVADALVEFGYSREYVSELIFNTPSKEWGKIRIDRFKEWVEEEKVQSGEWGQDEGMEDIEGGEEGGGEFGEFGGDEEAADESGFFTFEHRTAPKRHMYSRLLAEGELDKFSDQQKDRSYLVERFNELCSEKVNDG